MIENIYAFKRKMNRRGIFWSFSGPVSQDLLAGTSDILRQKMKMENADPSVVDSVFFIVSEMARNVIRYSDEKSPKNNIIEGGGGLSIGIIAVGFEDNRYFVMGGNMIENGKVDDFRKKLLKLQDIGREGIGTDRKGTDFGFASDSGCFKMASKASEPMEFDFEKVDDETSFFSLKLII